MSGRIDARLAELGIELPKAAAPVAAYVPAVRTGNQLFISGQIPLWNGELRQPLPLVHPRALVSTSPQDGFLHPSNEMDSLGYDRPEVSCDLAGIPL